MNIELILKSMETNLFFFTREEVEEIKKRVTASPEKMATLHKLGEELLEMREYSVLDKTRVAPSGDKKDYVSFATYWWPNPDSEDGLPYITRDGEMNPEGYEYDKYNMKRIGYSAWATGLFYMITGEKKYLDKFMRFIHTWFLDEKTGMNPHLKYAQFIPGVCEGRCIGLIDTATYLPYLLNVFEMLDREGALPSGFVTGFRGWVGEYTEWITTSSFGREENEKMNNHGTFHDIQVMALALFTGRSELAKRQLDTALERFAAQIDDEGKQVYEIKRTKSFNYTLMGIKGQMDVLTLGERVGENCWNNELLKRSCEWMAEYLRGDKKWEYEQIIPVDKSICTYPILKMKEKFGIEAGLEDTGDADTIPNLLLR